MSQVPFHSSEHGESKVDDRLARPDLLTRSTSEDQQSNVVLDLLQPLLQAEKDGLMATETVINVRKSIQEAVDSNKNRTHQLVLDNYPSISHSIRTAAEVQEGLESIASEVKGLERQIEPNGTTSLLPPLLSFLEEHNTNARAHAKASARLRTLKTVMQRRDAVQRLEQAVWSGHGAEEDVLEQLKAASAMQSEGNSGTNVEAIINARVRSLRDLLVEQIIATFHRVIAFSTEPDTGAILTVRRTFSLERGKLTKSSLAPKPSPKVIDNLPTVTVPQLLEALGRLDELQPLLTTTQKVIMKDIVRPLLPTSGDDRRWIVEESSTEDLVLLRLIPSPEDAEPDTAQTLAGLQAVFTFVTSHLAAAESAWVPPFHNSLRSAILQTTLDCLVQSTIPDALSDLPGWLDRTRKTVAFEKAILDASSTEEAERPLQRFADTQAAQTWANRRRQMVADHVRQLIDGPGGWRGWDGRTVQRKTDISEIVEVEVDDDEQTAPVPAHSNAPVSSDTDADFGWGFDDEAVPPASSSTSPAPAEEIEVDDGWGFDDKADGSAKPTADVSADSIEDGWDFDDAAVPAPTPVVPKKPVREARKLGKLKAKHSQKPTYPLSSPSSRSPRTSFDKPPKERQGDGWSEGWEDQGSPSKRSKKELAPDPVTKPRKVVLQERKRVVEESLLISVACDDAVETARQVLRDSVQIESSISHVSPEDLAASQVALRNSARDVFDLYRALMPLTFGRQLRDVPSIAMQLYNDCNHLADEVSALKTEFELWTETSEDLEHRLRVFGQRNFEAQMSLHKESILESLQEADGFVDTVTEASFRKCERAVRQATHKLESLNRVWRGVLPPSIRQDVVGKLVDETVSQMASSILALPDITELESNRIGELCKLMHPLDQLFVSPESGKSTIVSVVPHWLKFCYVSELMQASLVDILYLFDTGALIDFETDEIVNLIRALFAETQQRANAVDHVQAGHPVVR